jgi:hypothetical protein
MNLKYCYDYISYVNLEVTAVEEITLTLQSQVVTTYTACFNNN